ARHVQAGLPGQPDGPGQRHRRHPGPRGSRAGAVPAPARRPRRQCQPARGGLTMATTWTDKKTEHLSSSHTAGGRRRRAPRPRESKNWIGGTISWIWLAIVIVPIYWVVVTSF